MLSGFKLISYDIVYVTTLPTVYCILNRVVFRGKRIIVDINIKTKARRYL